MILKIRGWHLPSMCVAPGSIPSTEEQTVLIFLFAMVFPHNTEFPVGKEAESLSVLLATTKTSAMTCKPNQVNPKLQPA